MAAQKILPKNSPEPDLGQREFQCRQCGYNTKHDFHLLYIPSSSNWPENNYVALTTEYPLEWEDEHGETIEYEPESVHWHVSICRACNQSSFWCGEKLVYPEITAESGFAPAHDYMPEDAKSLYEEAVAVFPHSRRASAALMRACAENLIKQVTTDLQSKTNFHDRVAHLIKQVSPPLVKGLTILRVLGNEALHGLPEQSEILVIYLDEDSVIPEILAQVINSVVEETIRTPRILDEAYEKIPADKRRTIDEALTENHLSQEEGR
ncbi:DUF4145 domain-containing protein [Microbacterium foliorum]|uniref:DUF4145 domain-containing protein n=1 Tax=Rothia terrae TaxID=396015 RepID=UPI0034334836